ncbi:hypothetical protein ASESINO_55 [Erwinia phage vB_EamM_Asesino]|uniref:Uncharacterized protein n=1 Tax=Erwinia phage vB_EamM_Asesino TaxID=1883370 RepID=A0A1B2I9W5_9CAUD|nr:hypothetical protein ASESINO_55 [Erwinia phage vB_EamM_Asesino]ANZ48068.1 hypothetical protein ASESINO_55 [Erwinia phage vB_EamM_Asesino]
MSRAKKSSGFNPRQNARDYIRKTMQGILSVSLLFEDETKILSAKIDQEAEVSGTIGYEPLRLFTLEKLDEAKAGFIGLMKEGKEKLDALNVAADAKAMELLNLVNENRWDAIKHTYPVLEMELASYATDATIIGQQIQGAAIEILSLYNGRVNFVKQALKNDVDWEVALKMLAEAEADQAKPVDEAAETVEEAAHV